LFIERVIGYSGPATDQVYDVTHRAFTPEAHPSHPLVWGAQFSVNSAGTRMLVGEAFLNAPFTTDTAFDAPYGSNAAVLGKSGDRIYVVVAGGVMELRATDFSAVAFFPIPNSSETGYIAVTGDGAQLALSASQVRFATLPPSVVAPDILGSGTPGVTAKLSFADQITGLSRH
jgi:hypothetical protein